MAAQPFLSSHAIARVGGGLKAVTRLVRFEPHGDERGMLVAIETGGEVEFLIKRVYYIYGTNRNFVRGRHAHRNLRQLLICVSGSCTLHTEGGDGKKASYRLDAPGIGLYVEGLVWREIRDLTPETVLLVLADEIYDEADYIRDYQDFLAIRAALYESPAETSSHDHHHPVL